MALPRNKLIPILALLALLMVGTIIYKQLKGDSPPLAGSVSAQQAESARGAGDRGAADADTPVETMNTVVASNKALRAQSQRLVDENKVLRSQVIMTPDELAALAAKKVAEDMRADAAAAAAAGLSGGSAASHAPAAAAATGAGAQPPNQSVYGPRPGLIDRVGSNIDSAITGAGTLLDGLKGNHQSTGGARTQGDARGLGFDGAPGSPVGGAQRTTTYRVIAPLGYAQGKDPSPAHAADQTPVLVRTRLAAGQDSPAPGGAAGGVTGQVAEPGGGSGGFGAASQGSPHREPEEATPYFTIPQNATLTRVTAMTAIIGRVPIDGRVTDPMQFKAIIGRENLAANGHRVPDDISGIVISGVAVGDMAMSCNEGKIYSLTFVFEDGSIRTVNGGGRSGAPGGAGTAGRTPLGYISDLWGNPCVGGQFVTNAPQYLTDVVGLRALGVASRAYAAAQTTTTTNAVTGADSTAVTGSRGAYVMGQAAAGATDEVTNWVLARLKNSFDAVYTPVGAKLVVHIDQTVSIDKDSAPRKLDYHHAGTASPRASGTRVVMTSGANHGLD